MSTGTYLSREHDLGRFDRIFDRVFGATQWCVMLVFFLGQSAVVQAQENAPAGVEVSPGVHLILPATWAVARRTADTVEINHIAPAPNKVEAVPPNAQIMLFTEQRKSVKESLARLVEIASETPGKPEVKSFAGFPGITKEYVAPLPQSGGSDQGETIGVSGRFGVVVLAVDRNVLHFTVVQISGADTIVFTEAMKILSRVQIANRPDRETLRANLSALRADLRRADKRLLDYRRTQSLNSIAYGTATPEQRPALTAKMVVTSVGRYSHVQDGEGELEAAVSADGQDVVVVANSGVSFSSDSGQTFHPASIPEPTDDPSVAVGKSGKFYYSWIGQSKKVASVAMSSDHGEHFRFVGNAAAPQENCTNGQLCVDQPHIAADRFSYSASGLDQLYVVWRDTGGSLKSPKISCSADGGQSWPTVKTVYDTASDIFPRISVGSDGAVFVIVATAQAILLNKYTSCEKGLQIAEGFPVTVASFTNVSCPVPGLDRCNNGNILSSPTVAEDDLDSNHVYVAWANATVAGKNEDILIADSADGGRTFARSTRLNAAVRGRRFMPWMTTYQGSAYVNWYDRRYSFVPGAASNDLTRYMGASASVVGGNLVAASEVDLSHVDDPQCSNLWPRAPRSEQDALLCSTPGQTAGRCFGTDIACDFKVPCAGGRQCTTGRGLPKYGDYNGVAAMAGKLYSFWTSIQPPVGVPVSSGDPGSSIDAKRLHIFGLIETLPRQ
jgi:hypothetical protein